jgi:hypothetical protein
MKTFKLFALGIVPGVIYGRMIAGRVAEDWTFISKASCSSSGSFRRCQGIEQDCYDAVML